MDSSRAKQRILHLLARAGASNSLVMKIEKSTKSSSSPAKVGLFSGLDLIAFRKLKQKKAIRSSGGHPYRITERGLILVRSQPDNR